MWDVKACRSCLTVKGKLEKIGEASKRQYAAVTGLQISDGDGYPSYFCMECRHHIRKSLAFRRKSRRAHFVLKEIMTIRKQVTFSDIVTVNRKRTNLESTIGYWEPHNNACYLVANQEGQDSQEEGMQKYNLQAAIYSKSYSKHLVEIEPEPVETPIQQQPTEIPVEPKEPQEDDTRDNDDTFNDIPTNDYLEPEEPEIDMNDVFKDLAESENNTDDDDGQEPKSNKRKKDGDDDLDLTGSQGSIATLVEALCVFDIKALTLEEQKQTMELRRKVYPFLNALYKCAMCLTVHKTMKELLDHVAYHNKRKFEHGCEVCKNKFPSVEELSIHAANCHMYEYQCRVCRSKAYCQADAVNHVKERHNNTDVRKSFVRDDVKRKIKSALDNFTLSPLSQQMMSEVMALRSRPLQKKSPKENIIYAGPKSWLKCDVCSIWLKDRDHLVKHMVLQHRYMYTCNTCKEVFTMRKQAIKHGATHKKGYECEECAVLFPTDAKLQRHYRMKHVVRIPCNVCGVSARNERLLYRHQLSKHKLISINDPLVGDPQHKCSQCGVQFSDKCGLETHLVDMNHAGAENVQHACVPCKKRYEDEEQLETHYITCNYSRKYPRKCCYCPEVLLNQSSYRSHYFRQHPSLPYRYMNKNSICDVCGKSVYKPYLETHLKTHTGSVHQCRLCEASHATAAQHLAHVLSRHARRPYRCAVCPRRFRYRSDCKSHILKVHAPTMLYKCEFCSAEFSYFRHLKAHSETLHNLVIPSIKPKFQFKSKTKIFVYAHMKILINELEKPIVELADVELMDYLEQKSKPVNYSDYFIFSSAAESQENIVSNEKKRIRTKKKKKTELQTAVDNIIVEWSEQSAVNEPSEVNNSEANNSEMNDSEMNDSEVNSEVKEVIKTEAMEVDMPMSLEVIESEGSQYVMIGGEMYRIACEDEVE